MTDETARSPDAASVRDEVRRLRRRMTLHGAFIYPVIAAEAALSHVEGKPGWAVFWIVLLVATLAAWFVGLGRDRRRDDVALGASDDAARAYLAARLHGAVVNAGKFGPWLVIGGAFLAIGVMDALRPEHASLARAAGNLLLGGYFVASRLHARFVALPTFVRERGALGEDVPEAGALLADRARAVVAAMGEVQAMVFWRETTGGSIKDAKAAVKSLALPA